jgi:hypothetical protein
MRIEPTTLQYSALDDYATVCPCVGISYWNILTELLQLPSILLCSPSCPCSQAYDHYAKLVRNETS